MMEWGVGGGLQILQSLVSFLPSWLQGPRATDGQRGAGGNWGEQQTAAQETQSGGIVPDEVQQIKCFYCTPG